MRPQYRWCAAEPCQNGATCEDGVISCVCAAGFTGEDCEVDIDECASSPCGNNANCVDLVDDYHCECAPGFVGQDCEVDADDAWMMTDRTRGLADGDPEHSGR